IQCPQPGPAARPQELTNVTNARCKLTTCAALGTCSRPRFLFSFSGRPRGGASANAPPRGRPLNRNPFMPSSRRLDDVLNRLAAAEQQFLGSEFLAPMPRGGVVQGRIAG